MEISEEQKRNFIKKLMTSRTRLLCNHPFFGLLLMNVNFILDNKQETASTNGEHIAFGIDFLDSLSDSEVDFVIMHELMHIVLKHCWRGNEFDDFWFNVACDIVVNSNILLDNNNDLSSITLKKYGESMHIAPDGKEGYNYTAEEVYYMLLKNVKIKKNSGKKKKNNNDNNNGFDDHSDWEEVYRNETLRDLWVKRIEDTGNLIEIRESSTGRGILPEFAKRLLKNLRKSELDWKTMLSNFIQEEVADYTFMPPDRRFDNGFFLPDFNGTEIKSEKILFMIDTSGSMSDDMVTNAYSEVKCAIDQFDGKLQGWLGFFDAGIIEPIPFVDEDSFKIIKPAGGGGTNFTCVFEYVSKFMTDDLPKNIVILTDGYAPFPNEEKALGIPVLWVINNTEITPPWGKVARILN